jgi:hypothetical protein
MMLFFWLRMAVAKVCGGKGGIDEMRVV